MSDIKLKMCPFCGGEAKINRIGHLWEWSVQCGNIDCTAHPETEGYEKCEEAIEVWNTRRPMEQIVEELEKEKQELSDIPGTIGEMTGLQKAMEIVRRGGAE